MKQSIKIFIITSVLLNILMAGVIIGLASKRFMPRPPLPFAQKLEALPLEKRELFENSMEKAEADTEKLRAAFGESRKRAGQLLKTEPFDRDAYLKEMQKGHEIRGQMMRRMAGSVADLAEKFTPEERASLADIVRDRRMRGKDAPPPPPPPAD